MSMVLLSPARLRAWSAAAVVLGIVAGCGGGGSEQAPAAAPPPSASAPPQAPPPAQPPVPPKPAEPTPQPSLPPRSTTSVVVPAPVGISSYLGDDSKPGLVDGTGGEARFNGIFAMAQDAGGNVYVIDQGKTVIRRITAQGVVSTLPSNDACYRKPHDLAVGNDGHLYMLVGDDARSRSICRRTPAGEVRHVFTQQTTQERLSTLARGPGNDVYAVAYSTQYLPATSSLYRVTPSGSATLVASMNYRAGGLAADDAGNAYLAGTGFGIQKVTPAGVVTTLAQMPLEGPRDVSAGLLNSSIDLRLGLAVERDGSVLVPFDSSLRRVTPEGQVTTVLGSENLFGLSGLASDGGGNVTFAVGNAVNRLLPDGTITPLAGRQLTDEFPLGVDAVGNLITEKTIFGFTPGRRNALLKRNPAGQLLAYANNALPWRGPSDTFAVQAAADGTVYASHSRRLPDSNTYTQTEIYRVTPAGEVTRTLLRAGDANFAVPRALAPTPDGTLYFVDEHRLAVRKLNPDGTVVSVTPDNELNRHVEPFQLAVAPNGTVYFTSLFTGDYLNRRLYAVNAAGRPEQRWGTELANPTSPVFDPQGNLYLLDNNALVRITPAGVVTRLASVPGSTETLLGRLEGARGLVRSADGLFYVRTESAIVRIRLAP